jgi:hypothetical protein
MPTPDELLAEIVRNPDDDAAPSRVCRRGGATRA